MSVNADIPERQLFKACNVRNGSQPPLDPANVPHPYPRRRLSPPSVAGLVDGQEVAYRGYRTHALHNPRTVNPVEPDVICAGKSPDPRSGDDEQIATPALPPVEGMAATQPRYAKGVWPIGQ